MRRLLSISALMGCLFLPVPSWTQDVPEEKVRVLCDETDPESNCPGPDCRCVPDSIEITFDGDSQSALEYEALAGKLPLEATVITDLRTEFVQGWSFSVTHDPRVLTLEDVSLEGTDADVDNFPGAVIFDATSMVDIQTCGPDPACLIDGRTDGGGWITAVVYFGIAVHLPLRRNSLTKARYVLTRDVGEEGTLIQFTDRLAKKLSPPTKMNVTVNGKARLWGTAIDGWIKGKADNRSFVRADANGDGKHNVTDAVLMIHVLVANVTAPFSCDDAYDAYDDGALDLTDGVFLLHCLFGGGQYPPEPFPTCGPDPTADSLACESFPLCR